jgi:uncharacterized protein YecT (DUF1311 family)
MKHTRHSIITLTAAILSGGFLAAQRLAAGQTQAQLDEQAYAAFHAADQQLNVVYKRVSVGLGPATKQKLIASERAWVVFRDAEANFEASAQAEGGSLYDTYFDQTRADLTRHRIEQLDSVLAP